jgi:hypothetical protein
MELNNAPAGCLWRTLHVMHVPSVIGSKSSFPTLPYPNPPPRSPSLCPSLASALPPNSFSHLPTPKIPPPSFHLPPSIANPTPYTLYLSNPLPHLYTMRPSELVKYNHNIQNHKSSNSHTETPSRIPRNIYMDCILRHRPEVHRCRRSIGRCNDSDHRSRREGKKAITKWCLDVL